MVSGEQEKALDWKGEEQVPEPLVRQDSKASVNNTGDHKDLLGVAG